MFLIFGLLCCFAGLAGCSESGNETPPMLNLIGKTRSEVTMKLGNPVDRVKVETKGTTAFIYRLNWSARVEVTYAKESGRADSFVLSIPPANQSNDPAEALGMCGLDLALSGATSDKNGYLWRRYSHGGHVGTVVLSRSANGRFYRCEGVFSLSKAGR